MRSASFLDASDQVESAFYLGKKFKQKNLEVHSTEKSLKFCTCRRYFVDFSAKSIKFVCVEFDSRIEEGVSALVLSNHERNNTVQNTTLHHQFTALVYVGIMPLSRPNYHCVCGESSCNEKCELFFKSSK